MRMAARFTKGEEVKYISHLDLQRLLQRALRRSSLPIGYSQGFNPHPVMSIALALPVGATSKAEYLDIELEGDVSPGDFMEAINRVLPDGVRVLEAMPVTKNISLTAAVEYAEYIITTGRKDAKEIIEETLSKDTIIEQKKGKGGIRDIDIRPLIMKLEEKNGEIFALLKSSSSETLSPALLVKSMFGDINAKFFRTALLSKDMRPLLYSVV